MERELTDAPVDITAGVPALVAGESYLVTADFNTRADAFLRYLVVNGVAFPDPAPQRTTKLFDGESIGVEVVAGQSVWFWNPFHAIVPGGIAINAA